jgi:hypothetical protein
MVMPRLSSKLLDVFGVHNPWSFAAEHTLASPTMTKDQIQMNARSLVRGVQEFMAMHAKNNIIRDPKGIISHGNALMAIRSFHEFSSHFLGLF